ncbi:MAG: RNA methyltransferase PUA domain-containing protein, partial [Opitutales bacterium]
MSRLHRSYIGPDRTWVDDRVTLEERESHHLAKVLRVREGDEIETFDGRGETRMARVVSVSPSSVELMSEVIRTECPEAPSFEIGVAVPKGKKMEDRKSV